MAQTVQLYGTIVHRPELVVLDEPFSGLDAINQEKLETLIRRPASEGVTILFSTHVIGHAERLCEQVAIIAEGKVAFEGAVDAARDRLRPIVRLRTRAADGDWRAALPSDAKKTPEGWQFELPPSGPEPLLRALLDGGAGIETLSIERPGLHDAFIAIAGAKAMRDMGEALPETRNEHRRDLPRRLRRRPPRFHCHGDEPKLHLLPPRPFVPAGDRDRVRVARDQDDRDADAPVLAVVLPPDEAKLFAEARQSLLPLLSQLRDSPPLELETITPTADREAQRRTLLDREDKPVLGVLDGSLASPVSAACCRRTAGRFERPA